MEREYGLATIMGLRIDLDLTIDSVHIKDLFCICCMQIFAVIVVNVENQISM